jgi:hypothetical protein
MIRSFFIVISQSRFGAALPNVREKRIVPLFPGRLARDGARRRQPGLSGPKSAKRRNALQDLKAN